MENDEQRLLERILKVSEDTNKMVHRMRREVAFGRFVRILYWLVILALGIAAYYFLRPYIATLDSLLKSATALQSKIPSF